MRRDEIITLELSMEVLKQTNSFMENNRGELQTKSNGALCTRKQALGLWLASER